MKNSRLMLLALAIPLVLGACSADHTNPVVAPEAVALDVYREVQTVYANSAWIGPGGGQVSVPGVGVQIPAGALSAPTLITITRNEDDSVELGPHGQTFSVDVELLFVAPLVCSAGEYTIEWLEPNSRSWTTIPSYVSVFGRAAALEHFSTYRIVFCK